MPNVHAEVTQCLAAMEDGDSEAADRLYEFIYDDLRELASKLFAQQRSDQTLQPTALVNEAYLRLAGKARSFEGSTHFFNVAAKAMRQILADHGRRRGAKKRGSESKKAALPVVELAGSSGETMDLGLLDDALVELEKLEPRQAKVFQLRYLTGLSTEEIASSIELSPRTVRLDAEMARLWITERLDK